jgi:predicted nucleic acid-binding protein
MTEGLVLVDTSVWIEALREGGDRVASERVKELLLQDRLAVWELIVGEVLVGAWDEGEYQRLATRLMGAQGLHAPESVWRRAARLGIGLRRTGHKAPLTDLAIAVVAMHNDAKLLHRDRHFPVIATICDLEQEYVGPPEPSGGEA